jgi:hypothetical protein
MRILTVRQPWAWAIIHAGKTVENRQTNVAGSYRGPVAIHAAKAMLTPEGWTDAGDTIAAITGARPLIVPPSEMGAIIGLVDLIDVHLGSRLPGHCWHDKTGMRELCSLWGETEAFHLVLQNPRPLTQPIPFRGMLGLRTLDGEIAEQVLAGVA